MSRRRKHKSGVFCPCMKWLVLFCSTLSFGQQAWMPQYYVGSGAVYDYYGKTGFAGITSFAARISTSSVYSYSTLEMSRDQSALRTGAGYLFINQGNWSLMALGDAGVATGSGPTLGSFSGGGFLNYDIGARLTEGKQHFFISVGGRVLNTSSQGPQPIFTILFGKGF